MTAVAKVDTVENMPLLPGTPPLIDMISQAIRAGQPIEVIRELKDMALTLSHEEARRAFESAMSAAKAEIPRIVKNRVVDFTSQRGRTNYRHEDLGEIAKVVDPILGRHGLSYRFETTTEAKLVRVACIVSHRDGHSVRNELVAGHDESGNKNSIQAIGSTITYLQRYTLKAALGLAASNDDDGGKADQHQNSLITPDQVEIIRLLIDQTKTDPAKFCEAFRIDEITDLPLVRLNEATQMLRTKLQRQQAAASQPAGEEASDA